MSEETRIKSEKIVSMDPNTLLEKLKYYFHHQTFKSDLQKNAIIAILKRKFIIIIIFCFFFQNVGKVYYSLVITF